MDTNDPRKRAYSLVFYPQDTMPANRRLTLLAALVSSIPEIQTLLARLTFKPSHMASDIIQRSLWRRQHQASAAVSHDKKRPQTQL